jgi:histone arginine demethylase JMJD6
VFIPGGWWHAVLNLSDTIAITQNIMTEINFESVWRSIRSERKKFARKFMKDLENNVFILFFLGL